jgi:hypothetical protein
MANGSVCLKTLLDQVGCNSSLIGWRYTIEQIRFQKESLLRRQHDDAGGFGLILKNCAGRSEDEREDQHDYNIVLPASPAKLPKDQFAQSTHRVFSLAM